VAERALSGLTVLDLSENISGPYCTRLLADYGATVIKIEKPHNVDAEIEKSGLFLFLNTSKKSITLNIDEKDGRDIFKRLVKQADIVIENFKPGTMKVLGLDYVALSKLKSDIIMASISYFGQTGPCRGWNGCDLVAQAMGGLMHLTGDPDKEPLKLPLSQAEYQAGLNAAVAILCAIYYRDATGEGQYIDISVQEAVASILEGAVSTYSYNGKALNRNGARHRSKCPSTIMKAKDGYVHMESSAYWDHFATMVETPQLTQPRLASILRYQYTDEIEGAIRPWVESRTANEIFDTGQQWRMPVAKVMGVEELDGDPQYEARSYFREIDNLEAGRLKYPGAPFKMSETPADTNRAPLLGEHNDEIYIGTLKLGRDELAKLRERNVI
jgi:crotonobetainyl-CoA:carnitine CoA-transferase CaiB-like acyl-CoA transferase